jgi:hypothetical protein
LKGFPFCYNAPLIVLGGILEAKMPRLPNVAADND